jgi:hypothetical protein
MGEGFGAHGVRKQSLEVWTGFRFYLVEKQELNSSETSCDN